MESSARILAGGCACGAVRFRTRGAPDRVAVCHCMTCRRASGSAFGVFVIFPAGQVDVEGELTGFASSAECERSFCPRCGASVLTRCNGEIELGLGAFDEPNLFAPEYEAWAIRREHWLPAVGSHSHPQGRPG
jgi:hypothetical protein